MRPIVFLSYSHIDRAKVDEIALCLEQFDVDVRRDVKDLRVTDILRDRIVGLVKSSGTVIVALSNNSINAPWVRHEREEALQQIARGAPLKIVYVIVDKNTYVPEEIQQQLYINWSNRERRAEEIIKLAKLFIHEPAVRQLGIYDLYYDVEDLNRRREHPDGGEGCSIHDFVRGARERIVSVGLWFGALFDMNRARSLAEQLADNANIQVDLYVPDVARAPIEQLKRTHENPEGVIERVANFHAEFVRWGKERKLTEQQAARIQLHPLDFIPTASYLFTDPDTPVGRLIVDMYAPGIEPSEQLKVELRGPTTEVYKTYLRSLRFIEHRALGGINTSCAS